MPTSSSRNPSSSSSLNPNPNPTAIPDHLLKHYNACFNNHTYHAFRAALEAQATTSALQEAQIVELMNWLIDASLEICGATIYEGAYLRLFGRLDALGESVCRLAAQHLRNFEDYDVSRSSSATSATVTERDEVAEQVTRLGLDAYHAVAQLKQQLQAIASGPRSRSWRGRSAHAWVAASASLLLAASAVHIDAGSDDYPFNRLQRAIRQIGAGLQEAVRVQAHRQAQAHVPSGLNLKPVIARQLAVCAAALLKAAAQLEEYSAEQR